MKKREIAIVVGLALIAIIAIFLLNRNPKVDGEMIGVVHQEKVILTFDSDVDATYTVTGLVGKMVIEVKDNAWHVKEVDCPNHNCEHMGWKDVDSIGIPITCIPNDIIIVPQSTIDNMGIEE